LSSEFINHLKNSQMKKSTFYSISDKYKLLISQKETELQRPLKHKEIYGLIFEDNGDATLTASITQVYLKHKELNRFYLYIILSIIPVFLLSTLYWIEYPAFNLKKSALQEILNLLPVFLFIALVIERALEVYIKTWRGPRTDELQNKIQWYKKRIKWLETAETFKSADEKNEKFKDDLKGLEDAEEALIYYKTDTRGIALFISFILGLLVSMSGIRAIQPLIDLPLTSIHVFNLSFIDIILTGGLLAGGSDGVHQLVRVFTDFLTASSAGIKKEDEISKKN